MDELVRISKKAADAWRNDAAYYQAAQLIDALCDRIINGVTFATDTNVGSKWISVEDRLPEEEFEEFTEQMDWDVYPCLCTVKNHVSGIRYVAKLFYDGSNFVDDEFVRYTSSVTHWMPLPKPAKED